MVEEVNCFGEWGGRTVSPHPHTYSTMVEFTMAGKTTAIIHAGVFPLSPRLCKNAHALAIRVPSIVVHSHAEGFFPVFRLHAQDFAGFNHAVVFLCELENGVAPSFTHGLICGFCIVAVYAPVGIL